MRHHDPNEAFRVAVEGNRIELRQEAETVHAMGFRFDELSVVHATKPPKHRPIASAVYALMTKPRFSFPQVIVQAMLEEQN